MIDLHLINVALAGLGTGVAAVLLIAAAILVIAAFGRRGRASHRTQLAPGSAAPTAAVTAGDQSTEGQGARVALDAHAAARRGTRSIAEPRHSETSASWPGRSSRRPARSRVGLCRSSAWIR